MKASHMKMHIPYRAVSDSPDRSVLAGQLMWVSADGCLCFPCGFGNGALLEQEWRSMQTVDFEVEEVSGYAVICDGRSEIFRKIEKKGEAYDG